MSTIAIAGASGKLGTLLVAGLRARGETVRVLTRDAARAKHLSDVEVTIGDVRDRASLDAFARGANVIVSAVHGFVGKGVSPESIDRDGNANLIDAAVKAGADFVLVSVTDASPTHPMSLMRMKFAAEERLKASGARWTIVRPTAFMETWVGVMMETSNAKHGPLVFGRGENPINFVSTRDVAALLERVVVDPSTRGETLLIGGPEDITFGAVAETVADAKHLGTPKRIPPFGVRMASLTVGLIKPQLGRQTRAALAMDGRDWRFAGKPSARDRYPDLPNTFLAEVLREPVA